MLQSVMVLHKIEIFVYGPNGVWTVICGKAGTYIEIEPVYRRREE